MLLTQYVSYALIAVGVFTVYMAFVGMMSKDRNKMRAKQLGSQKAILDSEAPSPLVSVLENFLSMFGVNIEDKTEDAAMLAKAGMNSHSALVCFLFFKRVVQPVLLVIGAWIIIKPLAINKTPISDALLPVFLGGFLVVAGAFGGKLFVENQREKRKAILSKTFPEALDLLLICVESGLGIDAALGRVCKEVKTSHPVIAEEFDRTRIEMNVMNDRMQALQNLSNRTEIPSIRALVSSLMQAERFGTGLVDTIRTIAEEQRTERMLRAEEKAARLPALVTIPLIFFILPSLFMIILGPVFIKISQQGGIFGGN